MAAAQLYGQPGIGQNGVVNSASQIPPTLAGSAIARGALFTVAGVRFSTTSGRTTVTVSRQGITLPVTIVSLQPRKLEAVMPEAAQPGTYDLVITADGRASRPFPVEVAAYNPGIFSRNLEGWGPGRVDNLDTRGNRSDNSPANPAHPGQKVSLATTGTGGAKQATVMIGTRAVVGQASNVGVRNGEERITFEIPADATLSCWVPVYIQATPLRASNVVTMAIRKGEAGSCDEGPITLLSGKSSLIAVFSRSRQKAARTGVADSVTDDAKILVKEAERKPVLSRTDFPPVGTCMTSTSSYQTDTELAISMATIVVSDSRSLDAGPAMGLTRRAAGGAEEKREIDKTAKDQGNYSARLGAGGSAVQRGTLPLFLQPGRYRLEERGGREAGPFAAEFSIPAPFQWLDRDQISTIDRSRGVTVHWTPSADAADVRNHVMAVVIRNVDRITTAIGTCLCTARASAGQFTVPAAMLANIPASIQARGERYDKLVLGSLTATVIPAVRVKGLDNVVVISVFDDGRIVDFH